METVPGHTKRTLFKYNKLFVLESCMPDEPKYFKKIRLEGK
jgi:hypothetical protein